MSEQRVFNGVSEVGVAVRDLDAALAKFGAVFGAVSPVREIPHPGVSMRFAYVEVGDQRINLMQDMGANGPIGAAIGQRGEGLFNVMVEVDDLDVAIERLRAAGVEFVEPEPRVFTNEVHGGRRYNRHRIMWIHPRSFHGLLVEVQEFDWADN